MAPVDDAPSTSSRAVDPVGRLASISVDCPDPEVLAEFYAALLGMRRVFQSPDGSVISLSDGGVHLTLMRVAEYATPTWPDPERPQQLHIDLAVADLDVAEARAIALGARKADHQAGPAIWRVLLDPAGHPFCLSTAGV